MTEKKSSRSKIATYIACILWLISIVLSFAVPPKSALIWLPDTTLLVGFLPLLYILKWRWPFILFGLINAFIGFCLQVVVFMPPGTLPKESLWMQEHLAQYHSPLAWIIFGCLTAAYGCICVAIRLFGKIFRA